jgi:glycosyltransferase involved in cell wall biosynthesis
VSARGRQRVRLLLVESATTIDSAQRLVWELATRLPDHRYALRVWLSPSPDVDPLADSLEARGIPVDRVAEIALPWTWGRMLTLWSQLRRLGPKLVHFHAGGSGAQPHLPTLARHAGAEHLVLTRHLSTTGLDPWARPAERRIFQSVDAVTVSSGAVREVLVQETGVDRERIRVVPNGVDPPDEPKERPAARRLRDQFGVGMFKPLWVCAARLEEAKGHAVLLEALARVKERGLDFVAALAGDGSLRSTLERLAVALGLDAQVRFLGHVDSIGPLILAADACVLASRWEAQPWFVLESMARARPVLAAAVGGVPELMDDGVHGRLVPADDPEALAAVLEEFHRKPDIPRRLGLSAAQRLGTSLTWDRSIEAFEAVYDDVLGLASFVAAKQEIRSGRVVQGHDARR